MLRATSHRPTPLFPNPPPQPALDVSPPPATRFPAALRVGCARWSASAGNWESHREHFDLLNLRNEA